MKAAWTEDYRRWFKLNQWIKIKLHFDQYEGWIDSKQMTSISEQEFEILSNELPELSIDLINLVSNQNNSYTSILLGSTMNIVKILDPKLTFEGAIISGKKNKNSIIETAHLYLNAIFIFFSRNNSTFKSQFWI